MNNFLVNPAIAGSGGYSSVNLTAREQWIGIEDGPSTYALSYHTRVMPNSYIKRRKNVRRKWNFGFTSGNVGAGAYVFSDRSGALGRTGIRVSYAYHLYNKSTGSQLSFGLSLIGYQMKFNEEKVILRDPDDDVWNAARESVFIPDADVGIYYSDPDFFVGLSVDQLLESTFKFGANSFDQFKLEKNYYLFGGYDFSLSRELVLSPSALVKFSESKALQGDLSVKLSYDQTYWGGLGYRTGDAIIIMAGMRIDRYIFAYAFDISLSNIMRRSYGSHEFVFALKWGQQDSRRYRWLNR
jgi:type IX secretion system PorP/SprF family membrane protein